MIDHFLYVGFPYAALAILFFGTAFRFSRQRYSITSLSSQVLEDRLLAFGSLPWHIGILVVLVGHLVPFLFPSFWQAATTNALFLRAVETAGFAAALLAAVGLGVLIVRRLVTARLQSVTTILDVVVLGLLFAQVTLGMIVAVRHPSGAAWAPSTLMTYARGLFVLQPDPRLVSDMPLAVRAHVVLAFATFALVPFSRLVHAFAVPVAYLFRLPQRIVWTTIRRAEQLAKRPQSDLEASRRSVLKGAFGLAVAGVLVGAGLLDKMLRFVTGDHMDRVAREKQMGLKLAQLQQTAGERALELDRMSSEYIGIAKLSDLKTGEGRYFIDYQMRPALAFMDEQGLPNLISAKCTHLGCTVGCTVDDKGCILCPCHISYFDLRTGSPREGSPAKDPLPRLGWVLRDGQGHVVASKAPDGPVEGTIDRTRSGAYEVCIARKFEEA